MIQFVLFSRKETNLKKSGDIQQSVLKSPFRIKRQEKAMTAHKRVSRN